MSRQRHQMDEVDLRILNRIQSDFPITERPFAEIARQVGVAEAEVIDRVRRLKAAGIIRRIGGNLVPGRVGYVSTLCAARVPAELVERFAEVVNRYPGVTHNYLRENDYNVWFTFIAPSMADIERHLAAIAAETGVEDILNLPATDVFKINAQFDV